MGLSTPSVVVGAHIFTSLVFPIGPHDVHEAQHEREAQRRVEIVEEVGQLVPPQRHREGVVAPHGSALGRPGNDQGGEQNALEPRELVKSGAHPQADLHVW